MGCNTLKAFKTAALISSWICMGLFSEVSSPTLPYLKKRVNSNYEEISRALVARSIGFLTGSLLSGVVGSRWPRLSHLWLALALFIAGGSTIAAPWCPNLAMVSAMFFLDGAGKGVICVVASTLVMELWKERAAVPTHSLHFSFGIGALIAPQVARPFIPQRSAQDKVSNSANQTLSSYAETESNNGNSSLAKSTLSVLVNSTAGERGEEYEERIEIVYAIMGGITILVGLVFVYFQLTSRREDDDSDGMMVKAKRTDPENSVCKRLASMCKGVKMPIVVFLGFLFVFWCLPTGAERAYGKFLFAYAVDGAMQMSPVTGTILESVFWASFTAGRGLATILSKWTPPQFLLAGEIFVKVVSAVLLAFLAQSNQTILFVVTAIFGSTVSPIFPAVCVWASQYVEMNAAMNAFAFLSASFGAFIFSWGTGYLFQYKGAQYLMYMMLLYAGATLLVYVGLLMFLKFGKLRRRVDRELEPTNVELEQFQ